jgi:hypothetical protein
MPVELQDCYAQLGTNKIVETFEQIAAINPLPANWTNPTPAQQWDYWREYHDWRIVRNMEAPQPGYRATAYSVYELDEGLCDLMVATQVNIADEAAAQAAAAEAARIAAAAPVAMATGVEVPVIVLVDDATKKGFGFIVDSEGQLVQPAYLEHASPTITPEERAARKAAVLAKWEAIKAAGKSGISGQLQTRIENIEKYLGWR